MANGQRTAQNVWRSGALAAVLGLCAAPASLAAQSSDCRMSVSATRVAVQVAAAAAVTGIEYGDMSRQGSWHMAQESDRMAVLADPSSHLHGLGSYAMARNFAAADCAGGTDSEFRRAALRGNALRGAAMSLAIGVAKEVSDGLYNGFSATDLAVDAIGAGYAVAQAYIPVLEHVTPSFSASPNAFRGERGVRGALTNYANQTLWLSTNVHEVLPTSVARVWPSAVRLSVGRRAYGGQTPSDYVVGLDIDAERLPGTNPLWMRVKHVMHNVRLPGPAMIITSRGTRAVGLYW
jgi:hypothetical protein